MHAKTSSTRRLHLQQALGMSAAIAMPVLLPRFARAQTRLKLTPSQSEGPFYPDLPMQEVDFDLLRHGTQQYNEGQPAWVRGVVLDEQGAPVKGAVVEIWQCDHTGTYRHSRSSGSAPMVFQGFGRVQVSHDGRYAFRTIKPVPYPGRPPHIHVKVKLGKIELLTTQMYVKDEASNRRDPLLRSLTEAQRAQLEAKFTPTPEGWQAEFPIVVQA